MDGVSEFVNRLLNIFSQNRPEGNGPVLRTENRMGLNVAFDHLYRWSWTIILPTNNANNALINH